MNLKISAIDMTRLILFKFCKEENINLLGGLVVNEIKDFGKTKGYKTDEMAKQYTIKDYNELIGIIKSKGVENFEFRPKQCI